MYKYKKNTLFKITVLCIGLLHASYSMGSYGFFSAQLFKNAMKYVHYASFTLPFWSSLKYKKEIQELKDPDAKVKKIIQDELRATYPNMDIDTITIKYHPRINTAASLALINKKILITNINNEDLLKDPESLLRFKGALRHEMGHIERNASSRLSASLCVAPIISHFIIEKITAPFMSKIRKKTISSQILGGLKYIPLGISKLCLTLGLICANRIYEETKADDLAIAHTTEPEVLEATGSFNYPNSLINRLTHPSSVSRNEKYLQAAKKLKKQ